MNVHQGRLSSLEYIQILNDVMNLNKNLCVARHFSRFDRELLLKTGGKRYIDVWPSHLFKPEENGLRWDNSCLFVLQLACILSMSSKWKSASLRVFICVNSLQVSFLNNLYANIHNTKDIFYLRDCTIFFSGHAYSRTATEVVIATIED